MPPARSLSSNRAFRDNTRALPRSTPANQRRHPYHISSRKHPCSAPLYPPRTSMNESLKHPFNVQELREIETTARDLYQRFRSSDQYVKYRERQSDRQQSEDQKWPDRLERAFFQGMLLGSASTCGHVRLTYDSTSQVGSHGTREDHLQGQIDGTQRADCRLHRGIDRPAS